MMKTTIAALLLSTACFAVPASAQVTDQTDQSEEDWRKSRKKRGTSDIYKPNRTRTGTGPNTPADPGDIGDVKPVTPVERLPSESRRHLMKQRAKAMAESADGDISDAAYEPSEEALGDEQLMRDEKEAWEFITTDMEGSGGQASQPSAGGPNKVAVVGRNGTRPAPGSRGGSTATLQEIMDAIRNGNGSTRAGRGSGSGEREASRGTGSGTGTSPMGSPIGVPGGMPGGTPGGQRSQGQGAQGQGSQEQGSQGQSPQGSDSGSGSADGSDQGSAQAPSGSDAGAQSGSSGANGEASSPAQAGADAASGAAASGSGEAVADASGAAGNPGDASDTTRGSVELSPLERIRQAREEGEAQGRRRSASEYLGER